LFSSLSPSDPCKTTNDGDPIVLYDHLADRWFISQFAWSQSSPANTTYQCIAISQTPDPTGGWYAYSFLVDNTDFSDYPKFGVWQDAYYMSANRFNWTSGTYTGQKVVAFERAKMLVGDPSATQIQLNYTTTSNPLMYALLPADLDGNASPPTGAPNPYVSFLDGATTDQLNIYYFHVDWTTPANSTFTLAATLNTAAFDSDMCGYLVNCIPQPNPSTTPLDALSDRLMYRLQYRNFGTYTTLVLNHTVDTNNSDHAGIRWYELRDSGAGWSINQQGTYSPDTDHRWMGSIAMNQNGDIALGYSVSSLTTYPSIRVAGRYSTDALNILSNETTVVAGAGYQTSPLHRWGDYSAMSVDPVDDCTFWYTQEYYASTSDHSWQTRIAAFKLRNCNTKVEIVYPKNNQVVGVPIRILVKQENIDFINSVFLTIDSQPPVDITSNFDGQYYYYDWDPASVPPGIHTFTASITDAVPETTTSTVTTIHTTNRNVFLPFIKR